ncbi:MAG: hypothetical protein IKP91_09660, partial [Bacteroidaceae bacterium]|nr:hypothetical protein [Bacteroidaceae bacterium]
MKRLALLSMLYLCATLLAVAAAPLCRQPGGVGDAPSAPDGSKYIAHYAIKLTGVTCDRDCGFMQKIVGDKFHDTEGVPYVRYRYADDVMNITWHASDNAFDYNIINKTDSAMAIHTSRIFARDWDDHPTSFGYSLERPWSPAIWSIPSGTVASGFLIPLGNYPDRPLLPNTYSTRRRAERESRKFIGKTFRMLFPVQVGTEVYKYRFTFVVDNISAITEWNEAEQQDTDDESKVVRNGEIEIYSPRSMKEKGVAAPVAPNNSKPIYAPLMERNDKPTGLLVDLLKRASLINYFNQHCQQEKVYLHLDNTAYFQGETIWYAANVVDAAMGGEAASKVLYVELLSPTGVVLKQQKLKITDGRCHGSFPLIDTSVEEAVALRGAIGYPSGYYQIRAYTRAMLNFDDAAIFSRVIPVYKAPEKEGEYDNPVMRQYNGKETYRPELAKADKPKALNVQFFPEGGHLIAGAECRIAFKATDEHGHGVNIDGMTDAEGNALTIPLQHGGMGCFIIVASDETKGQDIYVRHGGKNYTFAFPKAERKGCTVRIDRAADSQLSVSVTARALDADSVLAYTITNHGQLCAFDTLHLACPPEPMLGSSVAYTSFTIPVEALPVGVCQFTLYNPAGDIYAQRLFFVDGEIPTQTLSVTSEKADIRPFDEIKLSFQINDSTAQQVNKQATFSLAVRDAADYGTAYRDDIRTYMLLSSELKGLIENPEWYFDGGQQVNRSTHFKELDLLMLVQGWTRYNWRQMAGVEPFKIRHYTEGQLVLDGWAFSRIKETPLEGVKIAVRLTSQDRQHQQQTTVTTDSLGYWSVGVEDFEGEWDLYMETRQKGDQKGDKTTRVRLERSSKPALYAYTPLETWLPTYAWNPDKMLTVQQARDSEYQMPSDSHLLQEVEVRGQRKYIDYYTFKAFDAHKDAELMLDEGGYTYKVMDYLRDKGYAVQLPDGLTFEDFMIDYDRNPEKRRLWPPLEEDINSLADSSVSRTIYYQWVSEQAPINGHRTFWFINNEKKNRTGPSFFDGFEMDIDEVKSVIVYDDLHMYTTFPAVRDFMTNRLIQECFERPKKELGFPAGLYIVELELNRKRRTRVKKNARSTSFEGYSPVVEFYAP